MENMKLDYKKTIYIGLAFLLISMFWQTYDNIIAKILIDKFGLSQTWSGVVMALDNVLALILLPLFGMLSDKTRSKLGRRTPYIIVGTIIGAIAFVSLSFIDNRQTAMVNEIQINGQPLVENYKEMTNAFAEGNMTIGDWEIIFDQIENERLTARDSDVIGVSDYESYEENIKNKYNTIIEQVANGATDSTILVSNQGDQRELTRLYYDYLSIRAWEMTRTDTTNLIMFIIILFIALISMSFFRSPAVALMPDVTLKPLRSKANAVINLMGALGGITSIILIAALGLSQASYVSYSPIFIATSILMILALIVFLIKVKENQLIEEYNQDIIKYDLEEEDIVEVNNEPAKLDKKKMVSLILILSSVFLWFAGYNAVISKLSDYIPKVLNMNFTTPLLVAQGTAIVAFIPIGILSSKLGRKRMILIGIILLALCFGAASLLTSDTGWVIFIVMGLTGIAWATINVNSYPMVVELATGSNVGKYTGYYYTFSMAAQIMTPILSGFLMDSVDYHILFPYAAVFVGLSFITMFFVKHGDAEIQKRSLLEMYDVED